MTRKKRSTFVWSCHCGWRIDHTYNNWPDYLSRPRWTSSGPEIGMACVPAAEAIIRMKNHGRLSGAVCISCVLLACGNPEQSLTDIDGNEYRVVQIGTQVWMAENLRVTRASDGEPVTTHFPNQDSNQISNFGRLYDWPSALRVAPKGWHLPTDDEWEIVAQLLGPNCAHKLKDTSHWTASDGRGTNESGFSARPAGYWNDHGFDNRFGVTAVFWSSTQADSQLVWSRTLSAVHDTLRRASQHPHYGFSVRCIKDRE